MLEHPVFQEQLGLLKQKEKKRKFCKHGLSHLLDVARIMQIKAYEEQIKLEKDVLYAAALLHDIGKYTQYETGEKHAAVGARMAPGILVDCQYTTEEISKISQAIASHNKEDEVDELGYLLRTSDKLSRNCFCCKAQEACNWTAEKKNRGISV